MVFLNDPLYETLKMVDEDLAGWADSNRERPKIGTSPLWSLMMSARNSEKRKKDLKSNILDDVVLGKPTRLCRVDKTLKHDSIEETFDNLELWRGHYFDKEILTKFYLYPSLIKPNACGQSVKRFCKMFKVPRWRAHLMIRSALLYFYKVHYHD